MFARNGFLIVALSLGTVSAHAADLPGPLVVDSENATLSFELDSTWHKIHGRAPRFSGLLEQSVPGDLNSVRGELRFAVADFDTDNSSRDERMREVMAAVEFPEVHFHVQSLEGLPGEIVAGQKLPLKVRGELEIRGKRRPLEFPAELVAKGTAGALVRGKARFSWKDFGVDDPSIVIAKLAPDMSVTIELNLPELK